MAACLAVFAMSQGCASSVEPTPTNEGSLEEPLTGRLTMAQTLAVARAAGVPCGDLVIAGAIAKAESDLLTSAVNHNGPTQGCGAGSDDRGLWQINDCYHPQYPASCVFEAYCNGRAMFDISSGGTNWRPWSTYLNGAYQAFLGEAQAAYNAGVSGCGGGGGGGPQCVNDPGVGDNCGDEHVISGGDMSTLYHCNGPGPATVITHCAYGCQDEPAGVNDKCKAPPARPGSRTRSA
jgi:hypothetical protein